MTVALEGGEWSAAHPSHTLLPGKTRYPLYRRLGGPQGRSARRKISSPTRIPSPNRPSCSHSLYRLSYPAHNLNVTTSYSCNIHFNIIFLLLIVLMVISFSALQVRSTRLFCDRKLIDQVACILKVNISLARR